MKMKKIMLCICSAALAVTFAYGLVSRNVSAAGNETADNNDQGTIAIDEAHFPDDSFRNKVKVFDLDEDGFLSEDERNAVKEFRCTLTNIQSIQGIEYFPELIDFDCFGNDITELDLSKNTKLVKLNCGGNQLTELDISKNTELVRLDCSDNKIRSLDCSNNRKIEILKCRALYDKELEKGLGVLSSVDISACTKLKELEVACNELTELDISKNLALTELDCGRNQLTELDVHANEELVQLICRNNQISSMDVHTNKNLKDLDCENNQIASLNVGEIDILYLCCENNLLTSVDVSSNSKLKSLCLSYNQIESIDVSKNPDLEMLTFAHNKLSSIDLTNNSNLFYLCTEGNDLKTVDIGKTKLVEDYTVDYVQDCGDYFYFETWTFGESGMPEDQIVLSFDKSTVIMNGEASYPTPTPEPPKDLTFKGFVERLYTVALNRESDPEGKEFWVKQVVEEGKTGADCARFFLLDAPEFMERNLSVEDFVETLYATFFDRESDAEGKTGWVDAINSGKKTRAEVVNDFIESTEWCDVCATYGVKSGAIYHKATKASENAIKFATRLYTCCLERHAEDDGLDYWALALTNLEKTGAEAAQFFFESDEFIGFKLSDEEYIRRLYSTFMGRKPVASEVDYWLGEIAAGRQNRHSILAFFAQSPEFTDICKKYGIDRGEIA